VVLNYALDHHAGLLEAKVNALNKLTSICWFICTCELIIAFAVNGSAFAKYARLPYYCCKLIRSWSSASSLAASTMTG
jgi:hypothetical protein